MNTPDKPRAAMLRTAHWLLVLLPITIAGGLFAAVLSLQHSSGNPSVTPSPAVVALAASYKRLYDIADSLAPDPVWSPDGAMLAAKGPPLDMGVDAGSAHAGPVVILNATTGQKIKAFDAATATASLTWSPDSHMLAATTYTSAIYILNVRSGAIVHTLTIPVPPNFPRVSPTSHLPLGGFLFSVSALGWSRATRHLIVIASVGAWVVQKEKGFPNPQPSHDGIVFQMLQEWDSDSGMLLKSTSLPLALQKISISPDGEYLVASRTDIIRATEQQPQPGSYSFTWELWSVAQGALTSRVGPDVVDLTSDFGSDIPGILWSQDSSRFALIVNARTLVVVDRATGQVQHTLPEHLQPIYTPTHYIPSPVSTAPPGHGRPPQPPMPVSTGGPWPPLPVSSVVAPTYMPEPTETPVPTPTIDVNWVQSVLDAGWSPDGKTLTAFYGDVLRLWDRSTGQAKWITRWASSDVYCCGPTSRKEVGWSSDGRMLALYVSGNLAHLSSLELVDAETGLPLRSLQDDVTRFEWSPDGPMLLLHIGNSGPTEVWGPPVSNTR